MEMNDSFSSIFTTRTGATRHTVLEPVSKGKSVRDIGCRAKDVAGVLSLTPCRLAESKHSEAS